MGTGWSGLSQHHWHLNFKQLYIFRRYSDRRPAVDSAIRHYVTGFAAAVCEKKKNQYFVETRRVHCLVESCVMADTLRSLYCHRITSQMFALDTVKLCQRNGKLTKNLDPIITFQLNINAIQSNNYI